MRFVLSAEICSLWTPFGGNSAQINHIAVLLTLATLESAGFAIKYHELLIRTLADCARARFPFDYHAALSEIHEDTRRAILNEHARGIATPQRFGNQRFPKGNNRAKGGKVRNTPNKGAKNTKGKKRSNKGTDAPAGKGPTPAPAAPTAVNSNTDRPAATGRNEFLDFVGGRFPPCFLSTFRFNKILLN